MDYPRVSSRVLLDDFYQGFTHRWVGLERMLRIYFLFLQHWYGLADEALEDALYDSQALRGFAGIDLAGERLPDATTVLHFRHWLERHELTKVLFDEVGAMLEEPGC